ncbi:MAG: outer membrane lipoprotein-sorting protein [Deltaproteobacteria bacterium]|nr:outer membrane lipoprotein-sorting protein [Deltaproteobacteria bacterium]
MNRAFFLCIIFFTSAAFAETGDELLKRADAAANNCKDQRFLITMTIEGSGATKVAKLETLEKGGEKRLIRFLAPGDVKGTTILMDGQAMYVYMPQFQKVRRVASHAKQQGFMDSDFTNDDMGSITWSSAFTAETLPETDKAYKLKLTPKPGADVGIEAAELTIDKQSLIVLQIDYLAGGKAIRRQTRANIKTFGQFVRPTVITMENLTKAHKTTMTLDEVKINTGIPDNLFTKQQLERAQ